MEIKSKIILHYENEHVAKQIHQSIRVDDGIFICSTVKKNSIHASIETSSLRSFQHTLDDYLSCIAVAENVLKSNKRKKR